jgi:hypothetical protein
MMRPLHDPGLRRLTAEGERRECLGAQVDHQDLGHREPEGDLPAGEREEQERHDLGHGMGEDVEDELAHVVIDPAARLDGSDDRGEVVVGEDHHGGFAGDVRP